jgi:O-succinylbenzoate synthase
LWLREISNLPVLDLHGAQDLTVVLDDNRAWAEAARARPATRVTARFASKVPITSSPIGTTNSSGN